MRCLLILRGCGYEHMKLVYFAFKPVFGTGKHPQVYSAGFNAAWGKISRLRGIAELVSGWVLRLCGAAVILEVFWRIIKSRRQVGPYPATRLPAVFIFDCRALPTGQIKNQ